MRVYFEEQKLAYAVIGYNRVDDIYFDQERNLYYIDVTAQFVADSIAEISSESNRRLFIGATDYARGSSGCIVKAKDYNNYLAGVTTLQGENIGVGMNFTYENGTLRITNASGTTISVEGKLLLNGFPATYNPPVAGASSSAQTPAENNTAIVLAITLPACAIILGAAAFVFLKKRKGAK